MAPGCQHGKKVKGELPYRCALHHLGATFYSSISKIVLGTSVLNVAVYWGKAGDIDRFFQPIQV